MKTIGNLNLNYFQDPARVSGLSFPVFVGSHKGPGSRFSGFFRVSLGSRVPVYQFFQGPARVPLGFRFSGFSRVPVFWLFQVPTRVPLGSHQGPGPRFYGMPVLIYEVKMINFIICFHPQWEVFFQIKFHSGMKFYSFHPRMKLTCKQTFFHLGTSFIPG